ncbi:MAG: nucleoside monophosphate kinase [Planctomycetes bacterium]|nr:nucleoside monophosphate kinase [Planctomycetota bacterium]
MQHSPRDDASILKWPEKTVERSHQIPSILMFGMPGVGKGTQGALLGSMRNLVHVSTGEIFRGLDPESEYGQEVARYIDLGELVPDEVTVAIWKHWLDGEFEAGRIRPTEDILILDGIPRSVRQCELMQKHIDVLAVIHLDPADDEPIIERLRGRAITGGRADDADETIIRKRMGIYRDKTSPVVHFYSDDIVHEIDPIGTQMEIKKRILEHVIPAIRSYEQAG